MFAVFHFGDSLTEGSQTHNEALGQILRWISVEDGNSMNRRTQRSFSELSVSHFYTTSSVSCLHHNNQILFTVYS